ncbi:MAG: hypothetical protein KAR32_06765, partial [Candidatus Omnitrophica bacterium]|nr:hypothetical protein [Candidatus Omnitrophota bacterium]
MDVKLGENPQIDLESHEGRQKIGSYLMALDRVFSLSPERNFELSIPDALEALMALSDNTAAALIWDKRQSLAEAVKPADFNMALTAYLAFLGEAEKLRVWLNERMVPWSKDEYTWHTIPEDLARTIDRVASFRNNKLDEMLMDFLKQPFKERRTRQAILESMAKYKSPQARLFILDILDKYSGHLSGPWKGNEDYFVEKCIAYASRFTDREMVNVLLKRVEAKFDEKDFVVRSLTTMAGQDEQVFKYLMELINGIDTPFEHTIAAIAALSHAVFVAGFNKQEFINEQNRDNFKEQLIALLLEKAEAARSYFLLFYIWEAFKLLNPSPATRQKIWEQFMDKDTKVWIAPNGDSGPVSNKKSIATDVAEISATMQSTLMSKEDRPRFKSNNFAEFLEELEEFADRWIRPVWFERP